MPPYGRARARVYPKSQSSRGLCSGYFSATLQHGRPTSSDQGRKVVQAGGTFMSFYLRDLCPQADHIGKTGPVVAAEEIMLISSF